MSAQHPATKGSVEGQPSPAQLFLSMLTAFGKSRELGLPPGVSIQMLDCPHCLNRADHVVAANNNAQCLHCGQMHAAQ